MTIKIVLPSVGESVSEATLASWSKAVGEYVEVDETLCSLETDKVSLDLPATKAGVIVKHLVKEGDEIKVGDPICEIDEKAKKPAAAPSAPEEKPVETKVDDKSVESAVPAESGKFALPAAAKMARENNIDTSKIATQNKSITKGDVFNAMSSGGSAGGVTSGANAGDVRADRREPMGGLRRAISKKLKDAQNNAAILTTFNEVDLSQLNKIRQNYREAFEKKHGVRLGFMSFFVKAVCDVLQHMPAVQARIDGNEVVYSGGCHIGIAVSTDTGLMVPIVRNAQNMSLAEIELEIANYAKKARAGAIGVADLQGGTFSITNGGVFGSLLSTPILNYPQSAILGMHRIVKRPVAVGDNVEIRPMMYLALSYDHRIIDGKEAVTFLTRVRELLEDPHRFLLDI